ncbi:unnamed protein product [Callosobruchus maculatus]|nr:unnamed protein product [Callosobruchus maculatus]
MENHSQNAIVNAETILQFFECPVCYNYVTAPLGQCVKGHVICLSCFDQLARCPVCRSRKSEVGASVLESIHSNILFPCKYRELGCRISTKGNDQRQHEAICEFAPLRCPLRQSNCHWEGNKHGLVEHLRSRHPEKTIFSNTQKFVFTRVLGDDLILMVVLFHTHDALFRAFWQFNKERGLMKFGVSRIDSRSDKEDDFFYSISLLDAHTEKETTKLICKCHISNQLIEDVIGSTNFVAFNYDMLRGSASEFGDIKCRIEIFKKHQPNSMVATVSGVKRRRDCDN